MNYDHCRCNINNNVLVGTYSTLGKGVDPYFDVVIIIIFITDKLRLKIMYNIQISGTTTTVGTLKIFKVGKLYKLQ